MGKKIGKAFLKILAGIIILLILLLLALRLPIVQTKIAHFAAGKLSKQLETKVAIDKVAMNFVDNASFKGIYIEDRQQDTLLYSKEISIDVAFFKLFKKLIEIDQLTMNTGIIKVKQNQDSIYNFQFLIDAFASEDTSTTPTEATFTIDLDKINISNVRAEADLMGDEHKLLFDDLTVQISKFDLDNSLFVFDNINLDGLSATSLVSASEENPSTATTTKDTPDLAFPLSALSFNIDIKKLRINDAYVSMKEKGYTPTNDFDPRYIDVKNLQFNLNNTTVNGEELKGNISKLSLNLNNQFKLQNFASEIIFDKQKFSLKSLLIETMESTAKGNLQANYQDFNDLINFDESVEIDVDIPQVSLSMNNLAYFVPTETLEPFRNEILSMNLRAKGTIKRLNLNKLHIQVGNTLIDANGKIINLVDPDNLSVQNFKLEGKADYEEYAIFLPNDTLKRQLKEIGDIKILANANGSMKLMKLNNLEIYTESLAEAKFSGTLENLSDTDSLRYNLKIHHITSGYQDAAIFVDSLPEIVEKFDTIKYAGTAKGDLYGIALDGGFITSLGDMDTDFNVKFNKEYTDATYYGEITLEEFDLRALLDNDSLNTISMNVKLDGSGLDAESIKTNLDANIKQVGYNDYIYENINIEGLVDGKKFSGLANIQDKNIKLDFIGAVDMNDSIPVMAFNLALDTLNLQKLNLSAEKFQVQLDIEADIAGLNPDEADGNLIIKNISLTKENKKWATDSIVLKASKVDHNKGLSLKADFLDARIEGDYQLSVLPDVVLDFLDQYFPLKTFLGQTRNEDDILDEQERKQVRNDMLESKILVYDATALAQFFDYPLTRLDTTTLVFSMDLPNNLTSFNFNIPAIIYDGYFVENIVATAKNNPESLESALSIDSISLTESIHLSGVNMNMSFKEQAAIINGLIKNQKSEESLGFTTRISSENKSQFSIDMIEKFILNNQTWNLDQTSSILASGEGVVIPKITLDNGKEAFSIAGTSEIIKLNFKDFNLDNLVEIIGIDSLDVSGLMNGDLEIGLNNEAPVAGDLLINDIRFNEFNIGDLDLEATKEGQDVTAVLSLKGEEVLLEGDVNYDLSSSYMFGKVLVEKLNLEPFNPFVLEYARNLTGAMQGYVAIDGQLSDPLLTGALYFQEVEAFVLPLATTYKIKEGKINISDGLIKPTATLEDEKGRLSYLKGDITHKYFDNIAFDLDFEAEKFQFLNSKQNKREYYYGSFVGKVKAKITGDLDLPVIDANITALEGTDFTVQLISSEAVLTQEDYIIFYDGSEIDSEDALDSISRKVYEPNSSIELNLTLSTSDEALFHVIVDPVTGDKLDIRGNSNLLVTIPANGNISLIGDYTVTEGNYRVSYENTIRRTFALDAGSQIVFQGDPTNARLDMRALYKADVNTQALLESSGNNIDGTGSRAEVNVVLNVDGTLSEPLLSFDIVIPESSESPVGNAVSIALSQLRQNETLLLEQVGSIILFNSFVGGSSGGNISSVGTSTAISSVGNLINGQLNKLASKAQGFEIDFNIDQYKEVSKDGNANVTEFGIGLQQKLFNDRLIISAGGNANLETGGNRNLETGQEPSNNFSSFAGDFVIQYILSKDGKLRVKVFQKSDFNALSNDNVWKTGAGLTYKTKFGQIKPKE